MLQNEEAPAVHSPRLFPPVLSHYCALCSGRPQKTLANPGNKTASLPSLSLLPSLFPHFPLTEAQTEAPWPYLNQYARMHCPECIPVSHGPLGHRLCYFNSEIALILTSTRDKSATPELTMRPVTFRQKQRPSFKNLWSGSAYTPRLIPSAALPGRSKTVGCGIQLGHMFSPLGFGHQELKFVHSSQGRTAGCPVPKTDRCAILSK